MVVRGLSSREIQNSLIRKDSKSAKLPPALPSVKALHVGSDARNGDVNNNVDFMKPPEPGVSASVYISSWLLLL